MKASAADRLSLTVAFAVMIHAAVVLGVSFNFESLTSPQSPAPALDMILVHKRTPEAPEEADYLAQVNQAGGGSAEDKRRPRAPVAGVVPKRETGLAPVPSQRAAPQPAPQTTPRLLTAPESDTSIHSPPPEEAQPRRPQREAQRRTLANREMARLEAEISKHLEDYARRPRRKFVSASTRESRYAEYMQQWVSKVERVGNLNYPDAARRQSLSGSLVLTVAIDRRGEVRSIRLVDSSGHAVLDDAAMRIIDLAAPFRPLPRAIRAETDVLHITRTWQFLRGKLMHD